MKSLTKQRTHNNLFQDKTADLIDRQDIPDRSINVIALRILRALLDDTKRFLPGTKGLQRDIVTLEARLEHEGISVLSVALATLGKSFDKGISDGHFTCPVGFKKLKGKKIPALFSGIFCAVFDAETGLLKVGDLTLEISLLRQLLYFLEEACYDGFFGRKARDTCESKLYACQLESTGNRNLFPRPTCACFTITPFRVRYLSGA